MTLFGAVSSVRSKQAVADVVRKVGGVQSVNNELQIVAAEIANCVLEKNDVIRSAVEHRLEARSDLEGSDIDVAVSNGAAHLTGRVGSPVHRRTALTVTRATSGVRAVLDELELAPPVGQFALNAASSGPGFASAFCHPTGRTRSRATPSSTSGGPPRLASLPRADAGMRVDPWHAVAVGPRPPRSSRPRRNRDRDRFSWLRSQKVEERNLEGHPVLDSWPRAGGRLGRHERRNAMRSHLIPTREATAMRSGLLPGRIVLGAVLVLASLGAGRAHPPAAARSLRVPRQLGSLLARRLQRCTARPAPSSSAARIRARST